MEQADRPVTPPQERLDKWARWMLHRRGSTAEAQKALTEFLYPVRDRVLDNAALQPGQTLLDVGAGDGLIAFGAIERVGKQGRVIFTDVSQDLLDHSRALAEEMGVLDRCQFVRAPAQDLSPVLDTSVDAVTTRSVLIFVQEKEQALREFHRVLKPGGRISLFEPINRFGYPPPPGTWMGFDITPVQEIVAKVRAIYDRIQPRDTDPMLDFDERDLLALAEREGFGEVHLQYEANIAPIEPRRWEDAIRIAGNPLIPTLEEAMREALTEEEARKLTEHLRPLTEAGQGTVHRAAAYLWAVKR